MGKIPTFRRPLARLPKRGIATLETLHKEKRLTGSALQARNRRLLQRNPLCVECQKEGRDVMVDEWDHVVPLWKGGVDDESNLQGLCHAHHDEKTERERMERAGLSPAAPQIFPIIHIVEPAIRRLIVYCGRPGAGKTTRAKSLAIGGDLVIDLDDLAIKLGMGMGMRTPDQIAKLIDARNTLLRAWAAGRMPQRICILTTIAATVAERRHWSRIRGAQLVVIDTPLSVCIERINERDITPEHKAQLIDVARRWEMGA